MRVLRSHHISNLVAVVDVFLPRAGVSPRGGRPVKLHSNDVITLLLFSSMAAPQRTLTGIYTWHKFTITESFIFQLTAVGCGSATRHFQAC